MANVTTTTANYILRIFQDNFFEEVTRYSYIYDKMKRKEATDLGREARISLQIAEARGLNVAAEGGLLPAGIPQQYIEFTVPRVYNNGTVSLTEQTLRLGESKGTVDAFGEVMAKEMEGLKLSMSQELSRQIYNVDNSGVMARVNDAAPSTTGTQLYAEQWNVNGSNGNGSYGTKFLKIGDTLAASATRGGTAHGFYTVTGLDDVNNKVALDNVTSLANGDYIFRATSSTASNSALEPVGIPAAIFSNSNTYMTFDRSSNTYYWWRPQIFYNDGTSDGSGTAGILTDLGIQNVLNYMQAKIRKVPDLWVTEPGVVQGLQTYLASFQRYDFISTGEAITGLNAFKARIGGKEIAAEIDYYAPRGTNAFINTESWKLWCIAGEGFKWVDRGEGILKYDYSNGARNIYSAYGSLWCYPVCHSPRENAALLQCARAGGT